MSIENRSMQYGAVFGDWHIERLLGSGSCGKSAVFSLYRDNSGWREYSALKVISLIEETGQQNAQPVYRVNEYNTATREQREKAEQEVRLMEQLRGKTNIVDYLDHQFFHWRDASGYGVDLLIRMEKLSDLRSELRKGRLFSEREIIKIGQDICQALIICHNKNILHRDIKPGNIFFNADGDYKLGDFGISRILDNTPAAIANTNIGTASYAAPEQFRSSYDKRIDIYSLGLVLYELSNGNRLPFATTGYASQDAVQLRLSGNPLPPPAGCQGASPMGVSRLSQIILKACAFRPEDRYGSAEEMLLALNQLAASPFAVQTTPLYAPSPAYSGAPSAAPQAAGQETKRGVNLVLVAGIAAAAVVIALLLVWFFPFDRTKEGGSLSNDTLPDPPSTTTGLDTQWVCRQHQWIPASCTKPATCSLCGIQEGTALAHQWAAATELSPKTCTLCGAAEGESLGRKLTSCLVLATSNPRGFDTDVTIGKWTDPLNNSYPNSIRFWVADLEGWSNTEYITYKLDTSFDKLQLTLCAEAESAENTRGRVMVYADGALLYESDWLTLSSPPVSAVLDISGVTELKIECTTDSPDSCYCIVDATLINTAS